MTSRAVILDRVRRNQPAPRPAPEVPTFDGPLAAPLATFTKALARMGGVVTEAPAQGSLDAFIRARFPQAKVICSATPEVVGTRDVQSVRHPADLDDVDVGVVRAVFGIAETGSVALSEREFGVNALGFLAQHLVVLLDPQAIVTNLHHAYQKRGFFDAAYTVLMTGPSATADIEGVLIRGAQGIRTIAVGGSIFGRRQQHATRLPTDCLQMDELRGRVIGHRPLYLPMVGRVGIEPTTKGL